MPRPHPAQFLVLVSIMLGGCASNGSRPKPVPTEPIIATPGLAPEYLLSSVQPPSDENRDDWPDMFHVVMYLFRQDSSQPQAFDGTFEFRVYNLNQSLIHRWVVGPEDAPGALGVRSGLTGYSFRLEMPPPEPDAWFPDRVLVETRFIPSGGLPQIARTVLIAFRIK